MECTRNVVWGFDEPNVATGALSAQDRSQHGPLVLLSGLANPTVTASGSPYPLALNSE